MIVILVGLVLFVLLPIGGSFDHQQPLPLSSNGAQQQAGGVGLDVEDVEFMSKKHGIILSRVGGIQGSDIARPSRYFSYLFVMD